MMLGKREIPLTWNLTSFRRNAEWFVENDPANQLMA